MNYYPIKTLHQLKEYLKVYVPLVKNVAESFSIKLTEDRFRGDHIGLQVLSKKEFDKCHKLLLPYSEVIHNAIIHKRRNRVYQFKKPLKVDGVVIPRIEIFEPKPEAVIRKLKAGIEHIAFVVKNYDRFLLACKKRKVPIDKEIEIGSSKFFKTSLLNLVEIEFRNNQLGFFEQDVRVAVCDFAEY